VKKEQRNPSQLEAIEVLQSPVRLDDEKLSSITGGCGEMPVSCTCGIVPEFPRV